MLMCASIIIQRSESQQQLTFRAIWAIYAGCCLYTFLASCCFIIVWWLTKQTAGQNPELHSNFRFLISAKMHHSIFLRAIVLHTVRRKGIMCCKSTSAEPMRMLATILDIWCAKVFQASVTNNSNLADFDSQHHKSVMYQARSKSSLLQSPMYLWHEKRCSTFFIVHLHVWANVATLEHAWNEACKYDAAMYVSWTTEITTRTFTTANETW